MPPAGELFVDVDFSNGDSLLSIDAINVPVTHIIKEASGRSHRNYIFASEPQGSLTCLVRNLKFDQFLAFALQSSEFTYRKQDNVYLIGGRNQEGLRNSRLVKLQYRTIDSLEHFIPDELKKGIDIKEFKELNSFILTGGTSQIEEVALFLRALDQPVPNIMIEVIVADLRKGVSIRTGVRAFLSDTVPAGTTGQVFPGLDIAVSSRSINNVLDRLSENGIVNLGRVTPRFYATLQVLEQNNMLNLRSTPKLSTLNGHMANLTIGQSRYYLEEYQAIAPGVNPFATISQQWKEVEANLSITIYPMVSGDEHITLDIVAEFSDFIEPEIKGAPPGNATRKFTSKIRVRNEEMIVLGGLEEVRKSSSRQGLPLITRIPILNWIFSARAQDNAEGKLIVFIKPTIMY
jgi:type IV pilus assembly protein PilQ